MAKGGTMFDGQTVVVQLLYLLESEAMEKEREAILAELMDLRHGKSVYDKHFPWWAKHVFGDASFAHEVLKKAARAASLVASGAEQEQINVHVDALEDNLFDLLNFCVMWLAWRRYKMKEIPHEVVERMKLLCESHT